VATGRERLFVIAVQGKPAEAAADFSFLEDQTASTSRGLHGGLEGLIARAGFPQFGARSAELGETSSAPNWMDVISFDVIGGGR